MSLCLALNGFLAYEPLHASLSMQQSASQGTDEQVIVFVRPGPTRNGIDFAVDGTHRILDRALLERFDVRHLHG